MIEPLCIVAFSVQDSNDTIRKRITAFSHELAENPDHLIPKNLVVSEDYATEMLKSVHYCQNALDVLEATQITSVCGRVTLGQLEGMRAWVEVCVSRYVVPEPPETGQSLETPSNCQDWCIFFDARKIRDEQTFHDACQRVKGMHENAEILEHKQTPQYALCVLRLPTHDHSVETVNEIRKLDYVSGIESNSGGHQKAL